MTDKNQTQKPATPKGKKQNKSTSSQEEKSDKSSVVPLGLNVESDSSKDPLRIMMEIAENEKLSDDDKVKLIELSKHRFTNRRKMAYRALNTLIFSIILLCVALFIDGVSDSTIIDSFKENQSVFIWLEGFLAAIVFAYYGVSAWKPSS